jgi:DNA-binding HxlR family transcriptional regulator
MPVTRKDQEKIAAFFSSGCATDQLCPVKDIMASYGDKWTMYTVLLLGQHGTMRFNELRDNINGISQRMLTVTLRSLEEDGIVWRTTYSEMPPRVEYVLTGMGETLLRQLLSLAGWARENFSAIVAARKTYQRAEAKRLTS